MIHGKYLCDSTRKSGETSLIYTMVLSGVCPGGPYPRVAMATDSSWNHGTRLSLEEEEEAESWWNALLKPVPLVELR